MKITEILTESQIEHLEEGPILNKIGSGLGKAAGAVAKGVGAVAGGVAGLGSAVKKGFQAGKQTVQGAGDQQPADAAAPTGASDINAAGPKGTAPAKAQTGAAAQAMAKTAQATQGANAEKVGQTVYAQVKSQVNQLDKKGKQRIMQLLQKSLAAPAVKPAAATTAERPPMNPQTGKPLTEPERQAHQDAGGEFDGETGDPLPIQKAPATTAAPAANTQAAPAAEPAPKKKRASRKKAAAPDQATIDADRDRLMGNFTDSVERHKQRMVAEGKISIFRK